MKLLQGLMNSPHALRLLEVLDRRTENRMTEFGMLAQAFEFAKINGVRGDYFEFGVWRGKTFIHARTMARRYRVSPIVFRAFDSFAGLPPVDKHTKHEVWKEGQFACSRTEFARILASKGFAPGEYDLIEGFYDQSLNDALVGRLSSAGVRASIVYVDCDLYESTVPVLRFIRHFLQDGTIICFDDYYNYRGQPGHGEQKALAEFLQNTPDIRLTPYMTYSPLGQSFICSLQSKG
ncbi:MAG TPA: TylF/MycF/NovP-related O-methyltransferase [Pedomonas sp.]|uniref:TylF/MycF/NovP-related O-methyltransferase n=1 Tax=Pedomonas sp. TaxID=2976421 RepID=UPI002F42A96C